MTAFVALLSWSVAMPSPGPLTCPAPLANRGAFKAGPALVQPFELVNTASTGTLFITKIETSCGCVRHGLSANRLMPGERATLAVEVNTLTQPDGRNRWPVQVHYTLDLPGEPGQPVRTQSGVLVLEIHAELSRDVNVTPPQLGFSTSGEATQTLVVSDGRAKPLTVVSAAASAPYLTVNVRPPSATANGVRGQHIAVKLNADAPEGLSEVAVVLATDDPLYPELRVPVRVQKRSPNAVQAAPEAVALRFVADQEEVSALVLLRAADGKPLEIAAAEADHPAVAMKWSPGAVPVAALRVTVGAAAESGQGTVRVRFRDPQQPELKIPVTWTRAGKN